MLQYENGKHVNHRPGREFSFFFHSFSAHTASCVDAINKAVYSCLWQIIITMLDTH